MNEIIITTDLENELYKEIIRLREVIDNLKFMIDNGLGFEDMQTDIIYPTT